MRKARRGWSVGLLLMAAVSLGACTDRQPTGQVLASIDDDDITARDLASEPRADGDATSAPAVLDRVVDRRLLVRRGLREKLDRTPEYLAAIRHFRETKLATLVAQELAQPAVSAVTDVAVAEYVRSHPRQYVDRALSLVAAPATPGVQRWIDGARLPPIAATRLERGGLGQVIDLGPELGRVLLLNRRSAPIDGGEARSSAREMLTRRAGDAAVIGAIGQERRSARIRYQQGFGPAATKPCNGTGDRSCR